MLLPLIPHYPLIKRLHTRRDASETEAWLFVRAMR